MSTLYLKYRSQTLEELDQERVRESLKKIIASGKLPHAFLFAGPKGTGKTSAARILAKIINCAKNKEKLGEPCNECEHCKAITKGMHLDVVELDAASNRGIDDVRSLKDKIMLSPATARKKIYIIDEAHMLTAEASNALLKTLEEPPSHVAFIFATTDPHKLPETIQSRLTTITFEKATVGEIKRQLTRVAKGEKLKLESGVEELIAKASGGSFRDAVKIFEQLMANLDKLTKESVEKFLFENRGLETEKFIALISNKDQKVVLEEVEKFVKAGGSVKAFLETILEKLHGRLLANSGIEEQKTQGKDNLNNEDLIHLIELFSKALEETPKGFISQLPLEIAIIKWCMGQGVLAQAREGKIETPKENKIHGVSNEAPQKKKIIVSGANIDEEGWRRVMETAKTINTTIEALLRATKPLGFDGKILTLGVYYQFHKERLEAVANRRILEEVLASVLGGSIEVVYTLTEREIPKAIEVPLTPTEDKDIISAAKEIFGN